MSGRANLTLLKAPITAEQLAAMFEKLTGHKPRCGQRCRADAAGIGVKEFLLAVSGRRWRNEKTLGNVGYGHRV